MDEAERLNVKLNGVTGNADPIKQQNHESFTI